MMADTRLIELGVSYRYAQEHGWVVNAITGFLSAYYMEDSRFRVNRRYDDLETGAHIWVCELGGAMLLQPVIKRLQVDIPPSLVTQSQDSGKGLTRYVLDLARMAPTGNQSEVGEV